MPNACRRRGDMRYMGGGAGGGRASEREGKRGESKCSWWASFRGHRDRDDGGQDDDGRGAEQRRLDFYRGPADGGFGDVSGDVRFD